MAASGLSQPYIFFKLAPARVAGHMHQRILIGDNLDAAVDERIEHAADFPVIARDDTRAE
jgi:hypothetical protein